jgi:hypothetical protein
MTQKTGSVNREMPFSSSNGKEEMNVNAIQREVIEMAGNTRRLPTGIIPVDQATAGENTEEETKEMREELRNNQAAYRKLQDGTESTQSQDMPPEMGALVDGPNETNLHKSMDPSAESLVGGAETKTGGDTSMENSGVMSEELTGNSLNKVSGNTRNKNCKIRNKIRGCECAHDYKVAQTWQDGRIRLTDLCDDITSIMLYPNGTYRRRISEDMSYLEEDQREEWRREIKAIKEKNESLGCELQWDGRTYTPHSALCPCQFMNFSFS